jgi:transposase
MLFSTSIDDAVPTDTDVRVFADVMDCLDYTEIENRCSSLGCPPYPTKEMVKILTYAYSKGIRSSRKIEHHLKVDVEFIWISGGLKPDHNTIARFRKDNWEQLTSLFKDSVRVCAEAGLVTLSVVATDGTKIKAASSARAIYGAKRLDRELAAVEKILKQAEETDAAEDKLYAPGSAQDKIPEKLRDAKNRRAHLKEIADRLKETGRSTTVETETDARVMKTSDGTRPSYNMQASVDSHAQVIVAMTLTQDEVDFGKLPEMTEQVESNTGCSPDVSLADTGYCDESTLWWIDETGHHVLMPIKESYRVKSRNDLFSSKCFAADETEDALICPAGRKLTFRVEHFCGGATYRQYGATECQSCSFYRSCVRTRYGSRRINVPISSHLRQAMKERLSTDAGKAAYKLRSQIVEPVFGQIKSNRLCGRFLAWGFNGASAESALACLAHNIGKCVKERAKAALHWLFILAVDSISYQAVAFHAAAA